MFQRFFVPLDGSTRAEKAIPVAANLARTCEGTVIFARVLVPPAGADEYAPTILANEMCLAQPKIVAEARDYLDEVLERYAEALEGIDDLITEVVPGHVPSTLLELSDQEHSDLIVMCSRGDSWLKRWVVGSVTQETFRHSLLPMLVLSERGNTLSLEGNPLRILVPLDRPASAEAILKPVFHLLSRVLALAPHTIHLFQVIATPPATGHFRSVANITDALQKKEQQAAAQALQALAQRLSRSKTAAAQCVFTTSVVMNPDVAGTIVKQAQAITDGCTPSYDMVALATHGRTGMKRAMLGSITEHVFGAISLPLLVVRSSIAGSDSKPDDVAKKAPAPGDHGVSTL